MSRLAKKPITLPAGVTVLSKVLHSSFWTKRKARLHTLSSCKAKLEGNTISSVRLLLKEKILLSGVSLGHSSRANQGCLRRIQKISRNPGCWLPF
jgi:hypothetical protein